METVPCPVCQSPAVWDVRQNPFRPFCSEHCKNKDLGKWANEEYSVPAEEETPGKDDKE
ncbi:MAG: DNA gyrase inhibitor YacG [Bdellovibrionaceae bacterium]|nr:DNA gyrase inhibitor YacG [Bdellovibrionales bacterium]MCB9253460.1 DNA gyrase inhibitor YacG [Pseudobdellovibrionaceae bacterium]